MECIFSLITQLAVMFDHMKFKIKAFLKLLFIFVVAYEKNIMRSLPQCVFQEC